MDLKSEAHKLTSLRLLGRKFDDFCPDKKLVWLKYCASLHYEFGSMGVKSFTNWGRECNCTVESRTLHIVNNEMFKFRGFIAPIYMNC